MEFITFFLSYAIQELPNWVGFFLPLLIQILNVRVHREVERYCISVIVCVLIAGLMHWHDIAFGNPGRALLSLGILFTESNLLYTLYFSRSGMRAGLIRLLGGTTQLQEPLEKVQPQDV
jgi:hypothetical protein